MCNVVSIYLYVYVTCVETVGACLCVSVYTCILCKIMSLKYSCFS